jgi:predicted nucleic acid-binding protein
MNGDFLLDTNTVIRLFAHDRAVEQRFDADPRILLPIFVLGELYYGAMKSALLEANCRRINDSPRTPKSLSPRRSPRKVRFPATSARSSKNTEILKA